MNLRIGDMAQLVERRVRNAKVRSSNLLISTTLYQSAPVADWYFYFLGFLRQNVNNFCLPIWKFGIFSCFLNSKLKFVRYLNARCFSDNPNCSELFAFSSTCFGTEKSLYQRHRFAYRCRLSFYAQ